MKMPNNNKNKITVYYITILFLLYNAVLSTVYFIGGQKLSSYVLKNVENSHLFLIDLIYFIPY